MSDKKSLIHDEPGNALGINGSVRDITEKFLAEKEKNKIHGQRQLAKKMEALGILAGGAAQTLIKSSPELSAIRSFFSWKYLRTVPCINRSLPSGNQEKRLHPSHRISWISSS